MSHRPSIDQVRDTVDQVKELTKPMLRGYSHAVMAPVAVVVTAYLAWVTAGDLPRQLSLLVYGCALVLLFTVSATYHIGNWPARAREVLRRFDHSNIFLVIAGTYTPITIVLLDGWWRIGILSVVWVLALTGIAVTVSGVPMRRGLMTALYIMVGWVAIAA
ncbi:MAG: hemolysin III family protein, partial [Candidatus Dormiibacterota bacterium]